MYTKYLTQEKKKRCFNTNAFPHAEVHDNAGLQMTTPRLLWGRVRCREKTLFTRHKVNIIVEEYSGDRPTHVSHFQTEWNTVPEMEAAVWPQVISPLVLHLAQKWTRNRTEKA